MKFSVTPLFVAAALAFSVAQAAASPSVQQERTNAASLLALGRLPETGDLPDGSVADLLGKHRQALGADAAAQHIVALKAFSDAFGRVPRAEELTDAAGTYTELMQKHVQFLAAHPDEYAQVLNRVYQLVIRRDVYPEEIEYWKKKDPQSFTVLVGCVDNWARRNQPGLMVTAGPAAVSVNCVFLTVVRLSPAVAEEARIAGGLPNGSTLLAAGAGKIATDGHMRFAAILKD